MPLSGMFDPSGGCGSGFQLPLRMGHRAGTPRPPACPHAPLHRRPASEVIIGPGQEIDFGDKLGPYQDGEDAHDGRPRNPR